MRKPVLHMAAAALAATSLSVQAHAQRLPDTVRFMSADGKTNLIGYVFMPSEKRAERTPAVVLMHGRAGPYSLNVKDTGPYNATTLTMRHKQWGTSWAALGYVAVLVDGFGPRGFWSGFGQGTIGERPEAVNEVTVRPLDAYGGLAYLRSRPDVARDRIGLQGWSNGGSAALAAMAVDAPGIKDHNATAGFQAALVFYAGCGLRDKYKQQGYKPYTSVLQFHGTKDEETGYATCRRLVERSRAMGGDIELVTYKDATHDFDDPGARRQRVPANQAARTDSIQRAETFFERILAKGLPPR
jgi:carboxymethylenebutenolidase